MVKKVKKTDYDECKSKEINKRMKLYERGALIIHGKKVTNQKQAIAIALQQSDSQCQPKMNSIDIKKIENKVKNATDYNTFTYSDLKRILFLYQYYEKKKSYVKANALQAKIISYLLINNELKTSYRKLITKSFISKK